MVDFFCLFKGLQQWLWCGNMGSNLGMSLGKDSPGVW